VGVSSIDDTSGTRKLPVASAPAKLRQFLEPDGKFQKVRRKPWAMRSEAAGVYRRCARSCAYEILNQRKSDVITR
jgi:hypothetical protein